jgi:hypothetical protein
VRRALAAAILAVAFALVGVPQASAAEPIWLNYGCTPGPADCGGWYQSPVRLSWDWNDIDADPTGGNCNTQIFSGDTPGTVVACQVTHMNGDSLRRQVTIRVDQTAPLVSPAPARAPDYNGWFNHPISVGFTGADATSGVQSCTSAGYGGPDAAGVVLTGSCSDVAGNVAHASFGLNYDGTPPPQPLVSAKPDNKRVTLRWGAPEAETIEVARLTSAGPALLYRGVDASFTDSRLRNGRRYRYLVVSIDRAGNRSFGGASAVPTNLPLLNPPRGARVNRPPLLIWEAVKRARYYNVQVYRGSKKVLSRWPRITRLQLTKTWRFAGHRRRLKPGRYTWYVFPGFGDRSKRNFGKLLGQSSFRVVK